MYYGSGILELIPNFKIYLDIMYATNKDLYVNKPSCSKSQPASSRKASVKTTILLVYYQLLKKTKISYNLFNELDYYIDHVCAVTNE